MPETAPTCGYMHVHSEKVSSILAKMPGDDTLFNLADIFRIFGDSTRIKILFTLYEGEVCVCDIAQILGMNMSAVSHQLKVLKNARLVKFRRAGKTVFYSLADDHVREMIAMGLEHIRE